MLVDTHCHMNMMVKKKFDSPMTPQELLNAQSIVDDAAAWGVITLINVGTSLIESRNCVLLANAYKGVYATVGIHPNDCTESWRKDFQEIKKLASLKKVVGIGECGVDRHYPNHNLSRQYDAFKAHIELALEHNLALVVHSRDAADETLQVIEEYQSDIQRAVMHCFSYDQQFADQVISWGFKIGLGGTITYPKNDDLRAVARLVDVHNIVLETDAPFLPVQSMRGQENDPKYIKTIAEYLAEIRGESLEYVSHQTTQSAFALFPILA